MVFLTSIGCLSLMGFWCLFVSKKTHKQCCDAIKLERTHCAGCRVMPQSSSVSTMSTVELYGISALFGIFLRQTSKSLETQYLLHFVHTICLHNLLFCQNWLDASACMICPMHSLVSTGWHCALDGGGGSNCPIHHPFHVKYLYICEKLILQ